MALKSVIKLADRATKFADIASNTGEEAMYGRFIKGVADGLIGRLQWGIDNGKNINGAPFKRSDPSPTREATIKMRKAKPMHSPDTPILYGTGKLRDSFSVTPTANNTKLKLDKNSAYNDYGKHHNSGFTTGSKSAIPNVPVPARKFWGIPRTWKEGGTAYNKAMSDLASTLKFTFKTYLDTGKIGVEFKFKGYGQLPWDS